MVRRWATKGCDYRVLLVGVFSLQLSARYAPLQNKMSEI